MIPLYVSNVPLDGKGDIPTGMKGIVCEYGYYDTETGQYGEWYNPSSMGTTLFGDCNPDLYYYGPDLYCINTLYPFTETTNYSGIYTKTETVYKRRYVPIDNSTMWQGPSYTAPYFPPKDTTTPCLPTGYYMGTSEREQIKYIFGIDPGTKSWGTISNSLANQVEKNRETIEVNVWTLDKNNKKVTAKLRLTVNKKVSAVVKLIFDEIYNDPEKFPFELNYTGAGGKRPKLSSLHNYGLAIDINWDVNPIYDSRATYNKLKNPVYKPGTNPYCITKNGSVVRAFKKYGWYWGGDWDSPIDFMHFAYMNH